MAGEHRFRSVRTGRAFELVIQEIQKAVVRGDLRPGERLPSEQDLAGQFGVGRSAVREALKVLELSGVLRVQRGYGGGTFVAEPDEEEFTEAPGPQIPTLEVTRRHLAQVRLAVEPAAAGLATAAGFAAIRPLREVQTRLEAFERRPARIVAASVEFHVGVARASGNPVFVAVLEALRPVMLRAMDPLARDPGLVERCHREHERVLKEIEGGDVGRAETAMRDHLTGGADDAVR